MRSARGQRISDCLDDAMRRVEDDLARAVGPDRYATFVSVLREIGADQSDLQVTRTALVTHNGAPRRPRRSTEPGRRAIVRWRTVLVLQIALGVLTSFYAIGRKSLWTDEGYTWSAAHRPLDQLVHVVVGDETNMGAYYLFVHGWQYLGDGPAMLRIPSALAMVATIPLLATLVDRTFDRRAAVVAGFLFAVSPMAVVYAQEARSYTLLVLTSTASMLLFLTLVDDDTDANGRRRWWAAAWVAVTVLGVYLHFFALLVVVAQLVAVAKRSDRLAVWRRLLLPTAIIGVLSIPVLLSVVFETADQIDWIPAVSPRRVASLPAWFSGDLAPWGIALLLSAGCLIAAAVWTVRAARPATHAPEVWRHALVWSWLVVPPVLTLVVSLVQPVWLMRYLIVSLPAFVVLVAVGATRARRSWVPVAVTAVLVASSTLYLVVDYYPSKQRWDVDWRAASSYLAESSAPGDAVIVQPTYGRNLLAYYARQDGHPDIDDVLLAPDDGLDTRMKSRNVGPDVLAERLAASDGPVWLVRHEWSAGGIAACTTDLGLRPVSARSFGYVAVIELERVGAPTTATGEVCASDSAVHSDTGAQGAAVAVSAASPARSGSGRGSSVGVQQPSTTE